MNRLGLVDIFGPSTTVSCLADQVLEEKEEVLDKAQSFYEETK